MWVIIIFEGCLNILIILEACLSKCPMGKQKWVGHVVMHLVEICKSLRPQACPFPAALGWKKQQAYCWGCSVAMGKLWNYHLNFMLYLHIHGRFILKDHLEGASLLTPLFFFLLAVMIVHLLDYIPIRCLLPPLWPSRQHMPDTHLNEA